MEVNNFMDLNTTELFDDSNESLDKIGECHNNETALGDIDEDNLDATLTAYNEHNVMMMGDVVPFTAGSKSTEVIIEAKLASKIEDVRFANSVSVPTAVITPTIPSGLSIIQKCPKSQTTADIIGANAQLVVENIPLQLNVRPTTVISKATGMYEPNKNLEIQTNAATCNDTKTSKISAVMNKEQLNSIAKLTKLHSALVTTVTESTTISAPTKVVKITPTNASLSTTNAISDIKTSPVIIVPAQKLGQKFTSVKILQKCSSPGAIIKPKILNFNEMRKLNTSGTLKPLLLNPSAPSSTISSTDTSCYMQTPPSLIVLKPPATSSSGTVTQASTTLQLKPQQLYQTIASTNPTKPATISFVTTSTPKPNSISVGTKLIPSRILTAVKPTTADSTLQPLPIGLTKIPKDTIVNKIPTKDIQGMDILRIMKSKQSEKVVEPTVTIGQKQMMNKPPAEYQSLTNFLNSNENSKSAAAAKLSEQPNTTHPLASNGKIIEKIDEIVTDEIDESETILNRKSTNPNGCVSVMKSLADVDVSVIEVSATSDVTNGQNKDKLNTSPRLLGRSKSLTIAKHQSKVRRRYPSSGAAIEKSTENVPTEIEWNRQKDVRTFRSDSITEIQDREVTIEILDDSENTKMADDSLECDEKIDDSDKSKSVSPDVIHSKSISYDVSANVRQASLGSSCKNKKIDDPLNYIKWINGIGYLRFSHLQFRKNEFNLLEVIDSKDSIKIQNSNKTALKLHSNPAEPIIAILDRRGDTSDKSSAIGKRKLEAKQRFKRAGMNLLQNVFVWELYLRLMDAQAAPDSLFINPFPSSPNLFEVGMKMEAIDPEHCSLFCVCTVVEKLGYRIRLSFDGYGDKFSFWRNADSMDIFPPGWCAKTARVLQPPPNYKSEPFDWHRYILKTNGKFAPRSNFTHLNSTTSRNPFKIGMKLEADHLKLGPNKVGVATIADVLDNRILLKFDGYDSTHDYWADITSPNIHPFDWHKTSKCRLMVPKEYEKHFSWPLYFGITHSKPVPKDLFCTRPPIGFREGMKLEIVDKKVPTLIRPCTVIQVADYSIQVLFDGWPSTYSYWIDDDHPDIHPINWCLKTEHPLEPPLNFGTEEFRSTCGVLGCREVGNAKHFGVGFHYTIFECPYESRNWLSADIKPDRLYDTCKTQKVKKRKAKPITSGTQPYQKMKFELPSSEENSLLNAPSDEWSATPTTIKNEETEIDHPKIQQTTLPSTTPENSITKLPRHIQVTELILRDYGPGLMNIHKLWRENSKSVNIRRIATNPICWTVDEVVDYVSRLPNCSKLGRLFRDHEIDGDSFLKLCQNDLVDLLEIRMGPAVKIYNQIVALRSEVCEKFMDTD
ncbi:Lethal(3)malignant brain tumor-like protein 3 [Pseudolycoriella hygida]|uniref:Lethal(3)malignant brain tumor-like protein 3 n=1 Tax=Pseudolycoriella hygida TaxID=35572 RepID=A0A9Q0N176_9DIPT|nr:Lethal(3)malignant brain tumor-like protein 3 [Pseudolycoriella hygida]